MGYMCDSCGAKKSLVYCRADAASLCLSCDQNVHSANALARRHSRTLLCERCYSEPACVTFVEDKISLCGLCDCMAYSATPSSSAHQRQTVGCYNGCPSAAELSTIFSTVLDTSIPSEAACEKGLSSMSITENSQINCSRPPQSNNERDMPVSTEVNDLKNTDELSARMPSSSKPKLETKQLNVDQAVGLGNLTFSKMSYSGTRSPDLCEDDGFYEGFNMDEVDLSIENYEELFGVAPNDPEQLFGNNGIGSLFGTKNQSSADLNCQRAYPAQGSSAGQGNALQPTCSNAASVDSVMSSKTEPNLYFAKPAHSSLSFSGLTGESSGGDYQDCGASPMLLMGEPPVGLPGSESTLPSTIRSDAVQRYREKKKNRKFGQKVRYESRKARADVRKRVKGRFVKAGDAYDYDPMSPTRTF